MLTLSHGRVRRGPQVLIEDATVSIFRGEKVGLVGRNGCGKSTLLALIRGEVSCDAGEYRAPAQLAIASVAQELPDSVRTLSEYIQDGDLELREVQEQLERAHTAGDGTLEATLHARLESLDGYRSQSRAAQLAAGLGFAPQHLEQPLRELSGGLKMRANLARTLMRRSDLLLLDEPTNHLDLDAVLWLESWLREYRGTLLFVSHDREFLDAIAGRILHIESTQLKDYAGNYSAFESQHAARLERDAALAARRTREAAHIESFVNRFRAKASKARQVQSRLKWLGRLESIAQVHEESAFEWEFAAPQKLPRPLLTLERVHAGYPQRSVLKGVSLSLNPGDRLGILGRNGAGKSTLMRVLAGELAPTGGERTAAADLAAGFLAQLELEQLQAEGSAFSELTRRGDELIGAWSAQQCRDHLGRFGFGGERVFAPIAQFSGGERARLALAILIARRPNLLLLDEPTNHLDLTMRHTLLLALQDFAGAVVIVSHDRALLRGACDRFVLVADGHCAPFDGDLEDYATYLGTQRADTASATAEDGPSRRAQRRLEAEARNRLTPLRNEQQQIEKRLSALGAQRADLERALADPATYTSRSIPEQQQLSRRHGELTAELARLEERWLEVATALEAAAS